MLVAVGCAPSLFAGNLHLVAGGAVVALRSECVGQVFSPFMWASVAPSSRFAGRGIPSPVRCWQRGRPGGERGVRAGTFECGPRDGAAAAFSPRAAGAGDGQSVRFFSSEGEVEEKPSLLKKNKPASASPLQALDTNGGQLWYCEESEGAASGDTVLDQSRFSSRVLHEDDVVDHRLLQQHGYLNTDQEHWAQARAFPFSCTALLLELLFFFPFFLLLLLLFSSLPPAFFPPLPLLLMRGGCRSCASTPPSSSRRTRCW